MRHGWLRGPIWSPYDDAAVLYVVLVLVHGWCWVTHTDGTHQVSRDVIVCPECDQDRAREMAT